MKQINGKNYYVSVGYIGQDTLQQNSGAVEAKDIKSIFFEPSKKSKKKDCGTAVYLDDTDKENIIAIPLILVNEIQRKGDVFKFRVLLDKSKVKLDELNPELLFNVVGLFEEYKQDGKQYLRHIRFFKTAGVEFIDNVARTISVEAERHIIMGE